jgi:hypothetical protein
VRVPVRIVDDDGVRCRQVDAQAARPVTFHTYSEQTVSFSDPCSLNPGPNPGLLLNPDPDPVC